MDTQNDNQKEVKQKKIVVAAVTKIGLYNELFEQLKKNQEMTNLMLQNLQNVTKE